MPAFYLFPRKNNVNHWFECFREFKYCKHHKHFLVDKQDVCYHKTKAEKCIFVVNISPVIFYLSTESFHFNFSIRTTRGFLFVEEMGTLPHNHLL